MRNFKIAIFACLSVFLFCTQVDFNNPLDRNGVNPNLEEIDSGDDDGDGIPNLYEDDDGDGVYNKEDPDNKLYVRDTIAPVFNIAGNDTVTIQLGGNLDDFKSKVKATDNLDGDITSKISVDISNVPTIVVGVYPVNYTVSDKDGNVANIIRYVKVVPQTVEDKTAPNISAKDTVYVNLGDAYTYKPTAYDAVDGNVTVTLKSGTVDKDKIGVYTLVYSASDKAGNSSTKTVHVKVEGTVQADKTSPVLTLIGKDTVQVKTFSEYKEEKCTAIDNHDGDISDKVEIYYGEFKAGAVEGMYTVKYTATDSTGNPGFAYRYVCLNCGAIDLEPPKFQIAGIDSVYSVPLRSTTRKVTATDNVDGNLTDSVHRTGTYDSTKLGTYNLIYYCFDNAGNRGTKNVKVTVVNANADTTKPVIKLTGTAVDTVAVDSSKTYADPGAKATDNGKTITCVVSGDEVDLKTAGTYVITYTATDSSGNVGTATRTVVVMVLDDKLLTKYGVPQASPFAKADVKFTSYSVEGVGADEYKITGFQSLNFSWGGTEFYYFAIQLASSTISNSNMTNTLSTAKPTITIKGLTDTKMTWLNTTYYVTMSEKNMIWVAKDGSFAITWKP